MVKGIVVEALTNNYYTIEFAAGPKIGEQEDINGDLVEPLQKKNQVMSDAVPERKEQTKKRQQPKSGNKEVTVALPKSKSTSDRQPSEKNRSESHWFKQTDNLLTME